ncbi:hypothetical protein NX784_16025 [Massilia pinisoli]|uniref:Secreted protein n=1 Tax=Massilia pinisoli TaxID=1772194 RepID=A0ABT1ZT47_9BURK|nr:DUF6683 family protein [Massilia pinisoli]MCS0583098.1 hypothetical protein [Massilia pinisoli]
MRTLLLSLALSIGVVPFAHAQVAGYGCCFQVWPQPDLRVPIPNEHGHAKPATSTPHVQADAPLKAPARSAVEKNARELAARFPVAQRPHMEQAFRRCMDIYAQLEKKLGLPERDMAGSLAAFLVGNYMVLNDVDVSDNAFRTVARQLRDQASMQASLRRGDAAQLRNLYEQTAMMGTFMALAHKSQQQTPQSPDAAAHIRDTARANLEEVLRMNPARLSISDTGFSVTGPVQP